MPGKTPPNGSEGQLRWQVSQGYLAIQKGPRRSERVDRAEISVTGQPACLLLPPREGRRIFCEEILPELLTVPDPQDEPSPSPRQDVKCRPQEVPARTPDVTAPDARRMSWVPEESSGAISASALAS